MSRCNGFCCREFFLPLQYEQIQQRANETPTPENRQIADMLIPITRARYTGISDNILHETPGPTYTCKHHLPNGDCGIYENRPKMCRNYPYGQPCPYIGCTYRVTEELCTVTDAALK